MSLQQLAPTPQNDHALAAAPVDRQLLLKQLLSSHDAILQFDPATGGLNGWAWPKKKDFDLDRLPVCYFAGHRATHWLTFPCCLCAQLCGEITESAIYIASAGQYRGFWVASCAQAMCGYFVPLEGFLAKEGILEREYPSRTPPPVVHVQENISIYQPEQCDTPGFLDIKTLYPIVAMPRYNPPPAVEHCVDEWMRRLDSWFKPGIPVEQFLELYAVCRCGMAVARRHFDSHECIPQV